mmetsp:Transcript_27587/g.58623  ORF Transcript_27587/g.58623 Transcript_27587/m.58623 type:complete len:98 (-) Transcript_27587:179-472(-)
MVFATIKGICITSTPAPKKMTGTEAQWTIQIFFLTPETMHHCLRSRECWTSSSIATRKSKIREKEADSASNFSSSKDKSESDYHHYNEWPITSCRCI